MDLTLEQNMDELFAEIYDQRFINSWNGQEAISPISSSSSSVAAAAAAAVEGTPQLISFENGRSNNTINADCINTTSSTTTLITSQIISFSPPISAANDDFGKQERVSAATRTPLQAQDHVMAERKRRENLSQLFIALSKLVPGLKKLDKASLLEDAINYLKALQERVTALEKEEEEEEDQITAVNVETLVSDNTARFPCTNDSSCELAPQPSEISVRISDKHVLIKICCKKQMGLMSRIPYELERIHLSVIDMRIMPFGGAALHVTILAQMQSEFIGTMKEIVEHLQAVLGQLIN